MAEPRKETLAEGVEIWMGDCREALPTIGRVDHIICDPPYEDELHKAFGQSIRRKDGREITERLSFGGINAERGDIATALVAASRGWVIAFTLAEGVRAWRDDLQSAGAKWDTTCFWVKPDASPRFNGQGPARGAECFVTCWAGTGYRRWNSGGKRGVYTHYVNVGRHGEHPTEKLLSLMREIVGDFTQPGDVVCDPFSGSGATGVAAIAMGRRFIGVEKDARWFDLSRRRLEAELAKPRLPLGDPAPVAKQSSMFAGDELTTGRRRPSELVAEYEVE